MTDNVAVKAMALTMPTAEAPTLTDVDVRQPGPSPLTQTPDGKVTVYLPVGTSARYVPSAPVVVVTEVCGPETFTTTPAAGRVGDVA